jgi:hypothetical protein
MGRAFHKKVSVPLGRGAKTHGTGVRYIDQKTPANPPTAPTPEDIAAIEALRAQYGVREWNIYVLNQVGSLALDAWEDGLLEKDNKEWGLGLPTEKVIDRALATISNAIVKSCNYDQVDIDRLIQSLGRHASSSSKYGSAMSFVVERFSQYFQKIEAAQKGGV